MRLATDLLFVSLGGAIGASARYGVSLVGRKLAPVHPELGTLLVNLVGCLAIGVLWTVLEDRATDRRMALVFVVGFVGSFTTFSTYALEGMEMLLHDHVRAGLVYLIGSTIAGVVLVFLGTMVGRRFF